MDFVALELIKNLPTRSNQEYFVFVNAKDSEIDTISFQNVTFMNTSLPYPVWEQMWLPRQVKKLNLDVLHCTANTFPVFGSVPIILTLHDVIFMEHNPLMNSSYTWYQRMGNCYRRFLVKHFLEKVNRIVTVSEFELNIMKKGFANTTVEDRLSYIYNGVGKYFNEELLSLTEKEALRKKYTLPDDYVLFLGNRDPKKNTPNTLKAFAKFAKLNDQVHLVVGDLDRSYIDKCLPAATHQSVKERIVPVGYIDNKDLPGLLKLARIFLYTSLRESFGIPLLEGMRCGTPVITSSRSSMPEIAADAALLVDPYDIHAIAMNLHMLWHDKVRRQDYTRKGIARSACFNWMQMSREYSLIYYKVA